MRGPAVRRWLGIGSCLLLVAALTAPVAAAQVATELGRQTLGRPYWHLFIAYALAWIVVAGWVISIARRLSRIERRLTQEPPAGG
jgi:CcmD family protein